MANSAICSAPKFTCPAASSVLIAQALCVAMLPCKIFEPTCISRPAISSKSLCASGTPCKGASASPRACCASSFLARAKAWSWSIRNTALKVRPIVSRRFKDQAVISCELNCLVAIPWATPTRSKSSKFAMLDILESEK